MNTKIIGLYNLGIVLKFNYSETFTVKVTLDIRKKLTYLRLNLNIR